MRWNGGENKVGYPGQGANPVWFQLPCDSIWTKEILKAIQIIDSYEKTIGDLDKEIKSM